MAEVFETTDVDVVEQILSSSYANMRIDARGQRGGLKMTRSGLGPSARLDHNQWTLTFDVTAAAPLGALAIGYLRDGQGCYRSDGSERRYGPGEVFLGPWPEHGWAGTTVNADIEVTMLDPALLSQVADTAPGRVQQPVRFTGYEPVSPQAAQTWKATSAYVRDAVPASPDPATQTLLVASMVRLLTAVALTTFPHNALTEPTSQDRHDAHPDTLRRAREFIDGHAREDITAADIAAAACVTVRAVQLAFRRHLDSTPTQYLQQVRLEAARRDLLTADPARTTVTAVAYRWGFASPSRFAASYRHAYGLSPRYTLRRD